MGSGGVAIAALPTVICLKVPFSDGLGGDSPGEGDFFSKDGYAYQKERKKTLHTCRKFFGIL